MKVIFSHGRSGQPDGNKIRRLSQIAENLGHGVDSIDYTDTQNPEVRANRLTSYLQENNDKLRNQEKQYRHSEGLCLVGSSMGAYASLVTAEKLPQHQIKGIFLMAPALYLPSYKQQHFKQLDCPIEIVHGWEDEVVLYEHSVRYARQQTQCQLHLVHDNHRLSQQEATVDGLFTSFLKTIAK